MDEKRGGSGRRGLGGGSGPMGRPYSELGEVFHGIARRRGVHGPHRIAAHVRARTGEGPSGSFWSQVLYGDKSPSRDTVRHFARAFGLSEADAEFVELAVTYVRVAPPSAS